MKKKDPTSHRIIEKRRRDRMNNCLADLSRLIPSHYMRKGRGRVEKTEIIEMAIRHLKDLRESLPGFQMDTHCELDSSTSPGPTREDLSSYAQQTVTTTTSTTTSGGESQQHVHPSPVTSCAMPLDFTNQMKGLQQPAAISADHASHMTDSHGAHNMATTHHQQPMLQNNNNNHHHHLHHHHQSLTAAASSASLSMKAFQHQQYHNNERQINNRASEQNNKYRSECCSCRGRVSARLNDTSINHNNNNNNNNSSSISNNSNQNNNSSSSDQSDTGSMDYPSSSSGSNKTQTVNKSTSESSSSGEGSPTSSLSSSSSHSSSSSSSSSSTGWYKKAWLIRSFSRSVSKN